MRLLKVTSFACLAELFRGFVGSPGEHPGRQSAAPEQHLLTEETTFAIHSTRMNSTFFFAIGVPENQTTPTPQASWTCPDTFGRGAVLDVIDLVVAFFRLKQMHVIMPKREAISNRWALQDDDQLRNGMGDFFRCSLFSLETSDVFGATPSCQKFRVTVSDVVGVTPSCQKVLLRFLFFWRIWRYAELSEFLCSCMYWSCGNSKYEICWSANTVSDFFTNGGMRMEFTNGNNDRLENCFVLQDSAVLEEQYLRNLERNWDRTELIPHICTKTGCL